MHGSVVSTANKLFIFYFLVPRGDKKRVKYFFYSNRGSSNFQSIGVDRSHLKRLWRPGVRKWYSKNGHCCEAKDFLMARHSCVHLIFWHFANIRNLNKKIMVINRGFLQTWSGFFLVGFHPLHTIWLRCFRCYAEHGEGKLSSCKNYVGIPCMRPF